MNFWPAPKSFTLCWASMPSSADLQRQPQVPNTGKFTWYIEQVTENEVGIYTERPIYKNNSV